MNSPKELFDHFKRLDELGRYELFLSLYNSPRPEEAQALESIFTGPDTLLKMQILQYLEELPEERAIQWILTLLEDDNIVIWRAALRAFKRNHFNRKSRLLRKLVLSREPRTARFAIRYLSQHGNMDVLPVLLARLEDADFQIRGEIIACLRFLPDQRAVKPLLEYAGAKGEETRFRAVRSLSDLKQRGCQIPPGVFIERVEDSSAKVRRIALDALRLYPTTEVSGIFLDKAMSKSEPASSRTHALEALSIVPNVKWVAPMVTLLAEETNPTIKLIAEISLRRFPRTLLKKGLEPLLSSKNDEVRIQSAIILAETCGTEPPVRRRILEMWERAAGNDAERLQLLEVLRELGGEDLIPILMEALKQSPLMAYSAITALNRLWNRRNSDKVLELLQDGAIPQVTKQTLLTWLNRKGPPDLVREPLFDWLRAGLRDDVMNIRYLSLQILAHYPLKDKLKEILDLLLIEEDPEVISTAHDQIVADLKANPIPLISAVREHGRWKDLTRHLFTMLKLGHWDGELSYDLLYGITLAPLEAQKNSPKELYALGIELLERGAMELEKFWLFVPEESLQTGFLQELKEAMRSDDRQLPALPVEYLDFHLAGKGPGVRKLLYEILELNRQESGVALLAGHLLREEDEEVRKAGRGNLARLIWTAQA